MKNPRGATLSYIALRLFFLYIEEQEGLDEINPRFFTYFLQLFNKR